MLSAQNLNDDDDDDNTAFGEHLLCRGQGTDILHVSLLCMHRYCKNEEIET